MNTASKLDFDQLYPGRFIKAGEFNGQDVTLTITDVKIEELPSDKGGTQMKGIIMFSQTKKQFVLNRTNGECLKAMFGRTVKPDWIGKRVTLYPKTIEVDGESQLAIRVKGSPDIEQPVTFELKLPRRRAVSLTMQVTGKKKPAPVAAAVPDEPNDELPENL